MSAALLQQIEYKPSTFEENGMLMRNYGSFQMTVGKNQYRDLQLDDISKQEPQVLEIKIDDAFLLTELALDNRDIIIYDVAPQIAIAEGSDKNQMNFKTFFDQEKKDFFIELNKQNYGHLSKTVLMKLIDIAEGLKAQNMYVCLRNTDNELGQLVRNLFLVGFQNISQQQQKEVSISETHTFYVYDLAE